MLHPDLDEIIRAVRAQGMIAGRLTNGLLLTPARIEDLDQAGLDYLQVNIDNVEPDEAFRKSLKVLDRRLRALAEQAEFEVTINSVIGGGMRTPEDALAIARRARSLGFSTTLGIIQSAASSTSPATSTSRAPSSSPRRSSRRTGDSPA